MTWKKTEIVTDKVVDGSRKCCRDGCCQTPQRERFWEHTHSWEGNHRHTKRKMRRIKGVMSPRSSMLSKRWRSAFAFRSSYRKSSGKNGTFIKLICDVTLITKKRPMGLNHSSTLRDAYLKNTCTVPSCGSSHHFTDFFFDIRLLKTRIQSLRKKERKSEQNGGSLGQRYGVCASCARSAWSQHRPRCWELQAQPFPCCHDRGWGAAGRPENHPTWKQLCLFVCLSCAMTQSCRSQVTCGHLPNRSSCSFTTVALHRPGSQSFISWLQSLHKFPLM